MFGRFCGVALIWFCLPFWVGCCACVLWCLVCLGGVVWALCSCALVVTVFVDCAFGFDLLLCLFFVTWCW